VTSHGLSDSLRASADMSHPRADIDKANQLTAIVRGPEGSPQFYLAIISITVQLGK